MTFSTEIRLAGLETHERKLCLSTPYLLEEVLSTGLDRGLEISIRVRGEEVSGAQRERAGYTEKFVREGREKQLEGNNRSLVRKNRTSRNMLKAIGDLQPTRKLFRARSPIRGHHC
jgi:hypothetical protein